VCRSKSKPRSLSGVFTFQNPIHQCSVRFFFDLISIC